MEETTRSHAARLAIRNFRIAADALLLIGRFKMNGRSGQRMGQGVSGNIISSDLIHWSWYMPFGLLTPASWVAMYTQRYMHEYGCTGLDLAEIAVSARKHAFNNPAAFFHGVPLTVEQHQASKWITEPLRLFDCCQESDGGCAQVIVSSRPDSFRCRPPHPRD